MPSESPVIVALDYPDADSALDFVGRIRADQCRLKVGKELFTRAGPELVRRLVGDGFDVFLDLKFHDIPNTVERACAAAADLGVWMVNVHASGGKPMMQAARKGVGEGADAPLLIAVTVLTSMSDEDLQSLGIEATAEQQVLRLAALTRDAGLDGVVCSPREAAPLREAMGNDFCLVTPGVRPADSAVGDQKRIMTPADAMRAGSSYLVIGRPVTQADDPVAKLEAINAELAAG